MDDQTQNNQQNKPQDPTLLPIPKEVPILPLHGFVFFPGMGFPLQIASSSSKQLVDEAMEGDRMIGLVLCHKKQVAENDTISSTDLHRVGAVGYLHKVSTTEEGYYQVLVSGIHKLTVNSFTQIANMKGISDRIHCGHNFCRQIDQITEFFKLITNP
ncbi:LON peptidase substrate-binding domain-containing protein [Desulfobulbus sp. TB]|nr:LON peptidase substrate-binding domain-containing protein [Desulfobulbus sp. TB]